MSLFRFSGCEWAHNLLITILPPVLWMVWTALADWKINKWLKETEQDDPTGCYNVGSRTFLGSFKKALLLDRRVNVGLPTTPTQRLTVAHKAETSQMTVGWCVDKQNVKYPHTESYPVMKRNEILPRTTTRVDLENSTLGDRSQAQWTTGSVSSSTENVQNRNSHRSRVNLWLPDSSTEGDDSYCSVDGVSLLAMTEMF